MAKKKSAGKKGRAKYVSKKKTAGRGSASAASTGANDVLVSVTGELPVLDHQDKRTRKQEYLELLDGFMEEDSLLNYARPEVLALGLGGGYLGCRYDPDAKKLFLVTEYTSPRKLSKEECQLLVNDTRGQWSDGVGEGCFDRFHELSGFSVETCISAKVTQSAGKATKLSDVASARKMETQWREAMKRNQPQGGKAELKKLMLAIEGNESAEAKKLAGTVNLNQTSKFKGSHYCDGETPLTLAVHRASPEIVKVLLDAGADPNVRQQDGHQPVHLCTHHGSLKLLLEAGANAKAVSEYVYAETPLHCPGNLADSKSLKLLISRGAKLDARNRFGRTPLMIAAEAGLYPAVKALVDAGANVNVVCKSENGTALASATSVFYYHDKDEGKQREKIIKLLVAAGARVTPGLVTNSVSYCNLNMLKTLLSSGVDANEAPRGDNRLLEATRYEEDDDKLLLALKAGADPNLCPEVLRHSVKRGKLRRVKALLAAGAKADQPLIEMAADSLPQAVPLFKKSQGVATKQVGKKKAVASANKKKITKKETTNKTVPRRPQREGK